MEVLRSVRLVLRFYQIFISPALQLGFGVRCRYEESCSHYAERMLGEHGLRKGVGLAVRRILSCNQWSTNG